MAKLDDVLALASKQHGLVSREQCRQAGIPRQHLRRHVEAGRLRFVTPRVLRVGGSATSPWQAAMAGVLDAGRDALASHLTAAAMWGVAGIRAEPVHVSMSRVLRRRDPAAVRIHHLTLIPPDQRTALYDIPVTGPALTTLCVFGKHGSGMGSRVLDHLLASRLLTVREAWQTLNRMARQGRNGVVAMRAVLEDREDGHMPPQSNNERRFEEIARRAGVTSLERQVDIEVPTWIGRVDYRDAAFPNLIVEVHSERYHTTSAHRRADAVRLRKLEAAGFVVLVVWDHEIWTMPDMVADRLRKARLQLRDGDLARRAQHLGA